MKSSDNYELDMFKKKFYEKAIPNSYHFKSWAKRTKSCVFLLHFMGRSSHMKLHLLCKPKDVHCKKKFFFFNLKACLFYATRIFEKLWNPNHLSCACAFSTFRYMIRKIVTSSFSTVEKLLEAAKNLSSNVSPQIISNSASLKSRRK